MDTQLGHLVVTGCHQGKQGYYPTCLGELHVQWVSASCVARLQVQQVPAAQLFVYVPD